MAKQQCDQAAIMYMYCTLLHSKSTIVFTTVFVATSSTSVFTLTPSFAVMSSIAFAPSTNSVFATLNSSVGFIALYICLLNIIQ